MSSLSGLSGLPSGSLGDTAWAAAQSLRASVTMGLLPSTDSSASGLSSPAAIYNAIGYQAMGALGGGQGWNAYVQAMNASGSGDAQSGSGDASQTGAADASSGSTGGTSQSGGSTGAKSPANMTDELLKESGWKAPAANPYQVNRDFMTHQAELDAHNPYAGQSSGNLYQATA